MTNDEKLVILKRITGETDDEVLSTYLSLAAGVVLTHAYPYGVLRKSRLNMTMFRLRLRRIC